MNFLSKWFQKATSSILPVQAAKINENNAKMTDGGPPVTIVWTDPKSRISKYFTVHEALWLPSWGIHHIPSEEEKANILATAQFVDQVREFLGKPVSIHCWIRPTSVNCPGSPHHGGNYNIAAGSTATHSAHIVGRAVDFDCGENCDITRAKLEPKLIPWKLRMEKKPASPWVHLDNMPTQDAYRYFIP
jgi:hypothetical protein